VSVRGVGSGIVVFKLDLKRVDVGFGGKWIINFLVCVY
jgi:hypothetical protein